MFARTRRPARTRTNTCTTTVLSILLIGLCFPSSASGGEIPEQLRGVYFPSSCLSGRSFEAIVHYMQAAGLGLAVLHAKDPLGRLFWKSGNPIARDMGASTGKASIETAVSALRQKGIWAAAKVDVFQDSLLVEYFPELGVMDSETGELWADHKGLHWANPFDRRVWEYTLDLCLELLDIGVDEIQFDYVRFPSDGNMSTLEYPVVLGDTSPAGCIGEFLAYARSRLKPRGAVISVDLFGMTAWKTGDFGVGQVLERIAPHVDVICPMLYPSHFPKNFLDLENPGLHPHRVMMSSLEAMKKRTDKDIRPWIQGFWYTPEEIDAQFRGVDESDIPAWTVWHPSGKYAETFRALEMRTGESYPEPVIYSPLADLRGRDDLVMPGRSEIINLTCYREGYTILSLDESLEEKYEYATIMGVVSTLDESIADRILAVRGIALSAWANRYTKDQRIVEFIVADLDLDPRRMRAEPLYIDWDGDAVFSRTVPPAVLALYESFSQGIQPVELDIQRKSLREGIR